MTNILDAFDTAVKAHPGRVAIVDGKGRSVTFAQLDARARDYAQAWRYRGVRTGDKVLLAMKVDADLYAALAALWRLGATAVLPEPALGLAGLRQAVKLGGISAFCSSGLYGILNYLLPQLWKLRHLRPTTTHGVSSDLPLPVDNDIALISFTSGTSGAPKAIARSHAFLSAQHDAVAPLLFNPQAQRDLVAFPVFVLINIASGQTSVLPNWKMSRLDKLAPTQLDSWITQQGVTRALLPPALCELLAKVAMPPSLHTVFTGGGPVFPDIIDALQAAKSDLNITCVYGSTEAEPIADLDVTDMTADDRAAMAKGRGLLVGPPVDKIRLRIVDDEIQVAGDHVNSGYLDPKHDAENKVAEAGILWHRTGDAGYLDDAGRIWLMGRVGSQVKLAGQMLYPFSVETAARQWTGVRQAALMADDVEPYLAIEGDPQHQDAWTAKAAALHIPRVVYVKKMPMDKRHGSKIDRVALRAQH